MTLRIRKKKRALKRKETTQIFTSIPPPPILILQKQKALGRTIFHAGHSYQGCEGLRETGSSRAQEVGHGIETGRQWDAHGHAQVAKQEDFHPHRGIAAVMLRH